MKVTVKNLQQETFIIDIEPTETVVQLKTAIETQCGSDYPVANQKLIYAGKILADDQLLSTYNIDEKKFIVVMVVKSKVVTKTESTTAITTTADTAASSDSGSSTVVSDRRQQGRGSGYEVGDSLVTGDQYEQTVNKIVAMGYDRAQVEQALAASFSNPERAIEYLINGIPDSSLEMLSEWGSNVGSDVDNSPLAFLRSQPQFQQMRAAIRQNPELLNNILQEIGERNPRLLTLINQNREAFLDMLNERDNVPVGQQQQQQQPQQQRQASTPGVQQQEQTAQASQQQVAGVPQEVVMNISQEDKRAIENLKALGFSEQLVIEAYFACEKNENLAANFLLSQSFDD